MKVVRDMTDEQARIQNLEHAVHSIDKRQETFEEFTKATIQRLEEMMKDNRARMDKMDQRMDKLEAEMKAMNKELGSKIDNLAKFLQNLTITATVGVLGIAGSVIYFVYSVTTKP